MSRSKTDQVFSGILGLCSLTAAAIILAIGFFLVLRSWPAISQVGWRVVTDGSWNPSELDGEPTFGLVPMVIGSFLVTLGAAILAAPAGIAIAVFCQFYLPLPWKWCVERLLFVSAAIPSVVYGFWGLVFLVPMISWWEPPGTSVLAGVVIVSLMILPTIAIVSQKALAEVDPDSVFAGVALGLGRWTIVRSVVLGQAKHGLGAATILGVTRAVGETMAVVMVCGNIPQVPQSLFEPVRCLTANIALEMGYALDFHQSVLFFSATFLLIVSFFLVIGIHYFLPGHASKRMGW